MSIKITPKKRPPVTPHANTRIVRLQGGGLRFLDAHEIPQKDFQVVTRPFQGFDTTQHWRINDVVGGSTIQQVSYLGEIEQYHLALPSGQTIKAFEQNPLEIRHIGAPLAVHIRPQDVLVLGA